MNTNGSNNVAQTGSIVDTAPVIQQKKSNFNNGPCYLKMLVSNLVAGSIIGKSGAVIGNIECTTGASMKLSPSTQFFPGTNDRIVVISGEQEQITQAMFIILDKICEVSSAQYVEMQSPAARCDITCKLVVPKSAVSGIIGKAGQQIKQLQDQSGAKIQISNREQGLEERIVTITGTVTSVRAAALQICTVIQEDQNLKDHMYVLYSMSPANSAAIGHPYASGSQMPFGGYGQFMGGTAGPFHNPYAAASPAAHQSTGGTELDRESLTDLMMEHCEIVLEIPDSYMGSVIGKGGVNLTEIMKSTSAMIKLSQKGDLVPGTTNRRVTVSGTVSAVHRAHARLVHRLKECQLSGNPVARVNSSVLGVGSYMSSGNHVPPTSQSSPYSYGLTQYPASQFQQFPTY